MSADRDEQVAAQNRESVLTEEECNARALVRAESQDRFRYYTETPAQWRARVGFDPSMIVRIAERLAMRDF